MRARIRDFGGGEVTSLTLRLKPSSPSSLAFRDVSVEVGARGGGVEVRRKVFFARFFPKKREERRDRRHF